jgi:ABC-2 type transport system permease protein
MGPTDMTAIVVATGGSERTDRKEKEREMAMSMSMSKTSGGYGLAQSLGAEVTKLRTIRSTTWTLLATVAGTLLVTFLATNGIHHSGPASRYFDPTNQSLSGIAIGQLTIGLLGVLMITSEYGSGTIRSSLAATPRRPLLAGAKVLVIAAVSLVVGEILTFACFFLGRAILSGHAPVATLGQPGVLRALLLTGGYLALLGMFGLGLGFIIRHTAGAITAFVGAIFLLPLLLQPLHADGNPARFTPESMLANSVAAVVHQSGQVNPYEGFLLMALYCTLALVVGTVLLNRRDA